MRICSIENCNHKHIAKGYCNTHYRNFCRNGNPLPKIKVVGCRVDGCDKKHYAKGYCNKHYMYLAWNKTAYQRRLSKGEIYFAGVCKASDCERGIYAKRYCRMHYARVCRVGTLDLVDARRFKSFPATKVNGMDELLTGDLIKIVFTRTILTSRERKIIIKRFWEGLTLAKTAAIFHLTRERIRQIEAEAIKKMKKFAERDMTNRQSRVGSILKEVENE